jgi:hypothetical protein
MAMASEEDMMTEVEGRNEEEMMDDVSALALKVSAATIDANSMKEYRSSCREEQQSSNGCFTDTEEVGAQADRSQLGCCVA